MAVFKIQLGPIENRHDDDLTVSGCNNWLLTAEARW